MHSDMHIPVSQTTQTQQLVNDRYSQQQQHQIESVFSPACPVPLSLAWISRALSLPTSSDQRGWCIGKVLGFSVVCKGWIRNY